MSVERHDAAARRIDAYGFNVCRRVGIAVGERSKAAPHGLAEVGPPVGGILLGPAGMRVGRFVGDGAGRADGMAGAGVEGAGADGLGAAVDADYERWCRWRGGRRGGYMPCGM